MPDKFQKRREATLVWKNSKNSSKSVGLGLGPVEWGTVDWGSKGTGKENMDPRKNSHCLCPPCPCPLCIYLMSYLNSLNPMLLKNITYIDWVFGALLSWLNKYIQVESRQTYLWFSSPFIVLLLPTFNFLTGKQC